MERAVGAEAQDRVPIECVAPGQGLGGGRLFVGRVVLQRQAAARGALRIDALARCRGAAVRDLRGGQVEEVVLGER